MKNDQNLPVDTNGRGTDFYSPIVLSAQDYYPFGMLMPGRVFNSPDFRYGYNTQEKVDEIAGAGNHYTAPFWEYDPRAVHRWNLDPVTFPGISPYAINFNNPILYNDPNGDCAICDELLNKATNYVVNKAKEAVVNTTTALVTATANYIHDKTTKVLSSTKVSVSGEVAVSAGAQYGGKVDKTTGNIKNYGSADILSLKVGIEWSPKDGFSGIWEPDYFGKDDEIDIRQSFSGNKDLKIPYVGVVGAGVDVEHTFTYDAKKVKTQSHNTSQNAGVSYMGVNVSAGLEQDFENKDLNIKTSVGMGGEAAAVVGLRGGVNAEIKATIIDGAK